MRSYIVVFMTIISKKKKEKKEQENARKEGLGTVILIFIFSVTEVVDGH